MVRRPLEANIADFQISQRRSVDTDSRGRMWKWCGSWGGGGMRSSPQNEVMRGLFWKLSKKRVKVLKKNQKMALNC